MNKTEKKRPEKTEKKKTAGKRLKAAAILLGCLAVAGIVSAAVIDARVRSAGGSMMISAGDAAEAGGFDCIVVLGCGVYDDGTPSPMLRDRLERAVDLYEAGAAPKLLMSGDHGRKDYDEVNAMKKIALDRGVPAEDIFTDHAGFSTYDTVYRAKEVFLAEKVLIVTQEYHLYRALYIAKRLGLDARGVGSDQHTYYGQRFRDLREVAARCKDFFGCVFKPEPTFLGDAIPISGDGRLSEG